MSSDDLGRFYDLLSRLRQRPGQGRQLRELNGRSGWPQRGVYFFLEPGETRTARTAVSRIVRVGTHAVSTGSKASLWDRLRAHRGGRSGTGNHRGSIFRLHVGAALLARDGVHLPTWGTGMSAPQVVRIGEREHERRVSDYIGAMSVLWIEVPDEPGPQSARAYIERNAIALLSSQLNPGDKPSSTWLGLHSADSKIRSSGLWNLNHVQQQYDPAFLTSLVAYV